MKTTVYQTLFVLLMVIGAVACTDKISVEQDVNVPIYMDYATLRASVQPAAARELVRPGKIYFKDNYLLIVEYLEGIHVVDLSNPAAPSNRSFIEIPGCTDLAVKENALYADNYVDLVVIDVSNLDAPKEVARVNSALPYTIPAPEMEGLPYSSVDEAKGIVVGWKVKRETREVEQVYRPSYPMYDYATAEGGSLGAWTTNGGSASSFGKSGSMARFGLYDDYLYIADSYMLYLFQVANAMAPVKSSQQWVNYGPVETMFIYAGNMFFGTPSGMVVYSLNVPSVPSDARSFWHTTSCDPVVVQDEYAYITLRGGTTCNNSTINRLDVVKCSNNYSRFELLNSYDLTEPYGLGIDGNILFICDGRAGLKVFDATDKQAIHQHLIAAFPSIQAYDVIPVNGFLFLIGDDGFYLYDYSNIQDIRQLGHIPVVKK